MSLAEYGGLFLKAAKLLPFLQLRLRVPNRVITVALAIVFGVALSQKNQPGYAWLTLLPILFDKRPWWLTRDTVPVTDFLLLYFPLLAALTTLAISAPAVVIAYAYGFAGACLGIWIALSKRKVRTAR